MKVVLSSDHAGFQLKKKVKEFLSEKGIEFSDIGTHSDESVDYPYYALRVAEEVAAGRFERGVVLCGSGVGVSIAANKVPGIRAANVSDADSARLSREHNDANILALGARTIDPKRAMEIIDIWLKTEFSGGRHKRRLDQVREIERKYSKSSE